MKQLFGVVCILFLFGFLVGCAGGLHSAAAKGDVKTINTLLDAGGNINENAMGIGGVSGGTPLFYAAYNCRAEAVRYLVSKGADVEAVGFFQGGFFSGRPLHAAVEKECFEVVQFLLDAGADINARVNSLRGAALDIAASNGSIKTIKYLIARGADIDDAITTVGKRGDNRALALLSKYAQPVTTAGPRLKEPVGPAIKSDIDTVPDFDASPRLDDFAVVIGVERYQGLPKSDYSKIDAERVKGYLHAMGIPERNIELITDERATKSAIEKSLEAWLPNRAKKNSTLIVYFSGHGAPEPAAGDAYLVPYDGDPNYLTQTGYPLKRLYEQLAKLPAREIIVLLDSCFSGAGGRSVLAKGARPLVMTADIITLPENIAVLTAAQGSQISTSSPEKGQGIFTYYFLKALKDGKKDIAEIYETIAPKVESEAKLLNVRQSPSISPDVGKLKGRFSLRK